MTGSLFTVLVAVVCAVSASAADWQLVTVPGTTNSTGPAWYRAWVKVPDSYFAAHERNLFEESVGVYIQDVAGAHEAWLNGKQIGTGSRGGGFHRHKVPVGTLRKGAWNELAIRISSDSSGQVGFRGDAPFIMDYFLECIMEGQWEFYADDNLKPDGAVTNRPPRAVFDRFRESNRVLGRAQQVHGPRLSPQESASKLRPAPDFSAELLLSEPLVAQPTHMSFDERGRLWVSQYRQYPYPAGLTMLSRDKYYRAHYDKVPPAPPNHDRGADIISIHEDSDGDGIYDKHKVFQDGLNMANAAVRGCGGVWVMHTPHLLFYPDRNFDDVPDGPPEVRLTGFGLEDTHSVANGLVWGPDGWLYGAQGSTTSCRVTRPGLDPTNAPGVYFEGCMVWRYHPESRAFELFSEGGGNTFGLEVDAHGRLHSGHNGSGTRGWHFVQGGFYQMQGVDPGKFGPPRNPYAFGDLPMMRTTNNAVRFTHFGAFGEGTALPSQSAGLLFSPDPLHNVVLTSERRPHGSTFETIDREPALRSDDETFRPLFVVNAPDGSLFLSDMCEYYIAHGQHYQNQIDPTTGRIYRLRGKDAPLEKDTNLERKTADELIALLSHPNKWHRHTAVRLLGERKDPAAASKLKLMVREAAGLPALNALWALHQSVGLDASTAIVAIKHSFASVRMWAVRFLGDQWGFNRNLGAGRHTPGKGTVPAQVFNALTRQAGVEEDPEVLAQYASTARRLDSEQALSLLKPILAHKEAVGDPYVPLLSWWVLEAHIPEANQQILDLLKSAPIWEEPIVIEHILPRLARRYAVEGKRPDLLLCAQLFRAAPTPRHAARLMKGLEEGFRGRPMSGLPDQLVSAVIASGHAPLVFRIKQGDQAAVTAAFERIQDVKEKTEERLALIRAFGEVRHPHAVTTLLAVVSSPAPAILRKAALVALSPYNDERIGRKIAELLPHTSGELQAAALNLLASRPDWSLHILENLRAGKLQELPDDIAERFRRSKDARVRELAAAVLPVRQPVASDLRTRISEVERILKTAPGNPYAGEATYEARCSACHKLFFKGGNVGPDLTGYQRDNAGTMLLSIIDPSVEIREGFQYYNVETKDGRALSGFFVERDNQVTVLRGLDGENIVLPSSEMADAKPMGRSLMPDGLLDGLTEQEVRDLFAYLRISQPITK